MGTGVTPKMRETHSMACGLAQLVTTRTLVSQVPRQEMKLAWHVLKVTIVKELTEISNSASQGTIVLRWQGVPRSIPVQQVLTNHSTDKLPTQIASNALLVVSAVKDQPHQLYAYQGIFVHLQEWKTINKSLALVVLINMMLVKHHALLVHRVLIVLLVQLSQCSALQVLIVLKQA